MTAAPPLPRWLQAYTQKPRAPQKAPPPNGAPKVERWSIPQELRTHRAWACWRYEYENQRWSKPPYQPEGIRAEASDLSTWAEFDDAYESYRQADYPADHISKRPYDGVSFALDTRWGIVGIDLDHVSEHQRDADHIVQALDSYTEWTPSRDGYRIFVKARLPDGRRRRDWVEIYRERRFLTVTGQHLARTPTTITSNQRALERVWKVWVQQDA